MQRMHTFFLIIYLFNRRAQELVIFLNLIAFLHPLVINLLLYVLEPFSIADVCLLTVNT